MLLVCLLLLFSVELVCVYGQLTQSGYCPNIGTHPNFDAQLYTGRWYEQEKIPTTFESNQICITADYFLIPDGRIRIVNRGYNVQQGRFVSISGDAIQNRANPSKLGVRFFPGQPRQPYIVLSTDYHSYSLVFSCQQTGNINNPTNQQFLWILSRDQRGISPSMRQTLLMISQRYGINTSYLTSTDQQNCPQH